MKTSMDQREGIVAISLALAVALLIKLPELFGFELHQHESFYAKNLSLFVFPLLTGFLLWKRTIERKSVLRLGVPFTLAALLANSYPFVPGADTETLLAFHLPIALWWVVGIAHTGGDWIRMEHRMNFIRFSGELFIFYVLLALGGGLLTAFMAMIFGTIGIDIEPLFESWLLPCGATGAVIIATWLVEARKGVVDHLAPVLAKLFTPLFTIVLLTFLGTLVGSGQRMAAERDVLIAFDLLLLIVLALLIYCVSARDPHTPPDLFDGLLVVLMISALLANGWALWVMSERILAGGWTPNRLAALGMNIILMSNLAGSTLFYGQFLRKRAPFKRLVKWQTDYLSVYALWAALVATLFPILFGFR